MIARLSILFAFFFATLTHAQSVPIPAPPQLGAKSWFLMDATTGHVIAESNADKRFEPASLTKMMTVYVAFHALKDGRIHLDDQVLVSEKAWRMEGSRMYIEVGKKVSVHDLLRGIVVQSGNDASVAMAEHIAGSEDAFVDIMNQYAQRLGMTNTTYRNSTGLPADGHMSTAHDEAVLARATIQEFPEYYSLYSEKDFTYNDIHQPNRNNLLYRDSSVDGLKTGHTDSAGYCLVSSAKREGMRLISVVMGMASEQAREDGSAALLSYGFRFYETRKVLTAGEEIAQARVWKGQADSVPLGVNDDVYMTIPRGSEDSVVTSTEIEDEIVAPVELDQALGSVEVSYNDESEHSLPLIALQAVPQAGLWSRIVDEISMWFE